MCEYIVYEKVLGKVMAETNSSWSWSRKEVLENFEREGAIIDAYMHEVDRLIGDSENLEEVALIPTERSDFHGCRTIGIEGGRVSSEDMDRLREG